MACPEETLTDLKPELDGGVIRERNGTRFFVRLWPGPIFLREDDSGVWRVVEDVRDDFNLTALVEARDALAARLSQKYPGLAASIVQGQQFLQGVALPAELLPLLHMQRRIEARERALQVIPPDLLDLVRRFPEAHFALLQLFAEHTEAVGLAQANPMLAFLLATSTQAPPEEMHHVLRSKRTAILRWLGFHRASKSLVRLLGKVQPWACRGKLVSALRQALQDKATIHRLRHLPTINLGCLAIASDKTSLRRVSDGFLREVAEDGEENRQPTTDLRLHVCLALEEKGHLTSLPMVFHARSKLESVLVAGAEHLPPEEIEALGLNPARPPIPDTKHLQALRTAEDVYEEGCDQFNCVWTLLPELVAGKRFLYRVLAPERATLAVQPSRDGFCIEELEGFGNAPVSSETRDTVQQWLDQANSVCRACGK